MAGIRVTTEQSITIGDKSVKAITVSNTLPGPVKFTVEDESTRLTMELTTEQINALFQFLGEYRCSFMYRKPPQNLTSSPFD